MQAFFRLCLLVTRDVLVALHIGAYGEVEGRLVSTHHADDTIRATHLAAFRLHSHTTHKAHLALQAFMLAGYTQERNLIAIHVDQYVFVGRCHIGRKCNLTFLAGCQMDSNDFVPTQWGYRLTLILHPIHAVSYYAFGFIQVQPAFVVLVGSVTRHCDIQVAKGLIGHTHILASTNGHYLLVGQILCLLVFSFENQLAHLWQILLRIGVHHIIRLSSPNGFFINLDMFYGRGTKHHSTHHAIADGQSLRPRLGGLVVPQTILFGCQR